MGKKISRVVPPRKICSSSTPSKLNLHCDDIMMISYYCSPSANDGKCWDVGSSRRTTEESRDDVMCCQNQITPIKMGQPCPDCVKTTRAYARTVLLAFAHVYIAAVAVISVRHPQ